jgi:hypothetical protein
MNIRLIPQLEHSPELVKIAQSRGGKIILLGWFLVPLYFMNPYGLEIGLTLIAMTFLPRYRRQILAVATPTLAILRPGWMPMASISRLVAQEGLAGRVNATLIARFAIGAMLVFLYTASSVVFRHVSARCSNARLFSGTLFSLGSC